MQRPARNAPQRPSRDDRLREKFEAAKLALEELRNEIYDYVDAKEVDKLPPWVQKEYGPILGDVASIVIENIHQKRDEVMYAAAHPEFEVSVKTTGADLINPLTDEKRELKVARVKKSSKRANFTFSFSERKRGETIPEFRARIVRDISSKLGTNELAVFIIKDWLGRTKKEYQLSGIFIHFYIMMNPAIPKRAINLGGPICKDCGECHRLEKLQRYDQTGDPLEFEQADWTEIFADTPANCGNPPAEDDA